MQKTRHAKVSFMVYWQQQELCQVRQFTYLYYGRLGFTSAADVVEMKGRVACEISTGDELLLTELIFHGVFNDLTVDQSVALLSCFVFDEKVQFFATSNPSL